MITHAQTDDFDISKDIFDKLKDLPPERQQRVLRWVAEGLGVQISTMVPQQAALPGASTPPKMSPEVSSSIGQATDIKSFMGAKSPKSDIQFAAAVAYFYRFEAPPAERRDSIDGSFLQEAARLAGRKRLSNPRITLNNAKSAGYLDGTSPGEFAVNSVGENLVAMTLPGGGGETPVRQTRRKKGKKSPSRGEAKVKKR